MAQVWCMRNETLSMDLRKRILKAYDRGESSQEQIAARFDVSYGMVKKLVQQRRHLGDIAPQHHRAGRKPRITRGQRSQLRLLVNQKPDLTLGQMREILVLDCTIQAIHYVLAGWGLTYKKRHSEPVNKTGRKSPGRAASGGSGRAASIPRDSSSSMSRGRKPI